MASEEQIALIRQGIEAWNDWREKNQNIIPDLREANLSNLDLSGANFSNLNLRKVNFYGSNLDRTDLNNANLDRANFRAANLNNANLNNCNLDYAIFKETIITSSTIIDEKSCLVWHILNQERTAIDLRGKDLSNSHLFQANLSKLDLSKTDLSKANLSHANLSQTELRETNLSNANLYQADLSNAYLFKANLQQANLNSTSLDGAYLREANLNYAILKNTQLSQKTIIEEKWRLAWEIVNTQALDNNFRHVDLSKIYFVGVDFHDTNLRYANLRGANFCGANLSNAKLEKADLQGAFYDAYTLFPENFNPQEVSMLERTNQHLSDKTLLSIAQQDRDLQQQQASRSQNFNLVSFCKAIFARLTNFRQVNK
jgi:uncharacterized protein YjbI with pentapeptide repeats